MKRLGGDLRLDLAGGGARLLIVDAQTGAPIATFDLARDGKAR